MSELSKYIGSEGICIDFKDGNPPIKFDLKMKDRLKLASLKGKPEEESLKIMGDVVKDIIKRVIPDSTEDELDTFLDKHFEFFIDQMMKQYSKMSDSEYEQKKTEILGKQKDL